MEKKHLLNNQIKAQRIMLLGEEREPDKMASFQEAIHLANEKGLDLMQVGQNKDVAICKIINYNSWLYHENKRKQKQDFKNRAQELKSINFRPVTDINDFNLKIKKINEFLNKGHKVKIVIKLKSREGSMRDINKTMVEKIIGAIEEYGALDSSISWGVKEINFLIKPEKKPLLKVKNN